VTVVEWADRAAPLLPPCRLDVAFAHGGRDRRSLAFTDRGLLSAGWEVSLQSAAGAS